VRLALLVTGDDEEEDGTTLVDSESKAVLEIMAELSEEEIADEELGNDDDSVLMTELEDALDVVVCHDVELPLDEKLDENLDVVLDDIVSRLDDPETYANIL
jgi:hypothetical protein